ncbi:MAG: hypothetical protein SNH79_04715 [Rikenellaceae bacterium]
MQKLEALATKLARIGHRDQYHLYDAETKRREQQLDKLAKSRIKKANIFPTFLKYAICRSVVYIAIYISLSVATLDHSETILKSNNAIQKICESVSIHAIIIMVLWFISSLFTSLIKSKVLLSVARDEPANWDKATDTALNLNNLGTVALVKQWVLWLQLGIFAFFLSGLSHGTDGNFILTSNLWIWYTILPVALAVVVGVNQVRQLGKITTLMVADTGLTGMEAYKKSWRLKPSIYKVKKEVVGTIWYRMIVQKLRSLQYKVFRDYMCVALAVIFGLYLLGVPEIILVVLFTLSLIALMNLTLFLLQWVGLHNDVKEAIIFIETRGCEDTISPEV